MIISRHLFKLAQYSASVALTILLFSTAAAGSAEQQYNALMEQVNIYYQERQFDKAISAAEKAIEVAGQAFGEDHALATTAIYTLAQLYTSIGMLQEAETQYRKLLDLYEQSFDAGELDKAIVRESLGNVYSSQGSFENAEEQYLQALNLKRAALGDGHPEVTTTLAGLAELYRKMGLYKRSVELFNRAISRLKTQVGQESPVYYNVLANHAKLAEDMGEYGHAEKLYRQVWSFDRKSVGDSHPNTIIDLNNLAGVQRKLGRYEEAEDNLEAVLKTARKILGKKHPETISIMNNLALLYENLGLYEQAEPLFSNAVQTAKTTLGETHPRTINIMNNMALLYESQGLFNKAAPLYLRVLGNSSNIKGVEHPETVAARNNLAFLHMLQRKYDRASKQFRLVLDIWEKTLGERHQNTLKALNNLARAASGQGRYEQAEPLFNKAMLMRREILGQEHPDTIRSLIDMGLMLRDLNRIEEATAYLKEALKLAEENLGDKHPYTFEALNGLADVYRSKGQAEKELELRKTGFERRNDFLDRVLWSTGENARQGYIRLHKPELDRFLEILVRHNSPASARLALQVSLKRKGLLLKIASEIHKISRLSGSPQLRHLADELQSAQKELAARTLSGPAGRSAREFQKELLALEKKRNQLQARLGEASLTYRNSSQQIEVEDVLSRLTPDAALVDFLTYSAKRDEVVAVVAVKEPGNNPVVELVSLGKLLILKQAVTEYRIMIQDEEAEESELKEAGQQLYTMIWKPLIPYLKNRSSVYIVPDSILHLLPFDTLVDDNGQYLLENPELRILSSTRELVTTDLPPVDKNLFILAGPDYDIDHMKSQKQKILARRSTANSGIRLASVGLRSLSFERLTGAELEGSAIKKVSDRQQIGSTIYARQKAEEQQLRKFQQPPGIVHIATHGFFLKPEESMIRRLLSLQRGARNRLPPPGDNPLLRAGLAFAGINANAPFLGDIATENDGILTALEVLKLNLSGTELVVLSACETGVGEIHAGEGVYGLRRAFQEAGVRNVLNSLWPVSDEGTRALMVEFYQHLLTGKNARNALRASQAAMLQSEWNHPYYWAAFVMVGGK